MTHAIRLNWFAGGAGRVLDRCPLLEQPSQACLITGETCSLHESGRLPATCPLRKGVGTLRLEIAKKDA